MWIGVDFDGTLSANEPGIDHEDAHTGVPIPAMVERVKKYLEAGFEVRILTARVAGPRGCVTAEGQRQLVEDWCEKHVGQRLAVTCMKDYNMLVLLDDRAIGVEKNTGRLAEDLNGRLPRL